MKNARIAIALGIVNTALLVGLISFSQSRASADTTPEVLRAQLIELVDAKGDVRAQFKIEENDEAVFRMRDKTGTVRVKLGVSEDGSGLVLFDARTEPGVHILAKDSSTTMKLNGKEILPAEQ